MVDRKVTPGTAHFTLAPHAPTVTGVLGNAAIRLIPRMEGVFIHSPWWPGERVKEITTWHNLNRHWQRFSAGQADVDVATSEAEAYPDAFLEGFLLVVVAPNTPVWAGPLITFERDNTTGITRLDALGIASLLDGQDAQQEVHYKASIGSGGVFRDLLASVNRQFHTGIYQGRVENGPAIVDLQVGGQSVWQSLEELHKRTNYEYWVDTDVSPAHLRAKLNWAIRQGLDLSDSVHLWEGVHYGREVYKRDMSQAKAAITAMGDFGALISERNSVTVLASGKRVSNGAAIKRTLSRLAPGLRNARTFHVPMTGNTAELEREARRGLVRPLNSSQTFNLSVNTLVDWMDVVVGNYVTIHPLNGPESVVRVVGYQPDEETGVNEIVAETVLV